MTDQQIIQASLASLLIGGGAYSGMRGLRDIKGPPVPEPGANELEITLPSSKVPKPNMLQHNKIAEDPSITETLARNAGGYMLPLLGIGGGAYAGFQGASKIYDHFENKNIEAEQEKAKQSYLASLQRASVKVGSIKTPNLDNFLSGYIDKVANEEPGFAEQAWSATKGEIGNGISNAWDFITRKAQQGSQMVAEQPITGMTAALGGLGTLGVAGATSYLAHRMDQNKEEAKRKTQLPTEIRLNVQ